MPLALTYSRSLTNIKKVFCKHWKILSLNTSFKEMFQNEPVTDFKCNKNLKKLIGSNKTCMIGMIKHTNIVKKDKCYPCLGNNRTLCCKQVISSLSIKGQQTNKSYTVFHKVNFSSAYVIYLMGCAFCKNLYAGKSETSFNIILNNHCKDVKKPDVISVCRHF